MNNPRISIVIPMYNQEKYIAECIDSILEQDFEDYEIIIIDDCSTDNSVKIVSERYLTHKNIRLIKSGINLGHARAKNIVISTSRGDYITFIYPNDFIAKNYLSKLYYYAEKTQFEIINMGITKYKLVNNEWKIKDTLNAVNEIVSMPNKVDRLYHMCSNKSVCNMGGKLYEASFIKMNSLMYEDFYVDNVIFHFRTLYYAKNYLLIPDNLYCIREMSNDAIRNQFIEKSRIILKEAIKVLPFLNKYFWEMSDIRDNEKLCQAIINFFFEMYFDHCYVTSLDQQIRTDFNRMKYEVLQTEFQQNYLFVNCLIEFYLKNRFGDGLKIKQLDGSSHKDLD